MQYYKFYLDCLTLPLLFVGFCIPQVIKFFILMIFYWFQFCCVNVDGTTKDKKLPEHKENKKLITFPYWFYIFYGKTPLLCYLCLAKITTLCVYIILQGSLVYWVTNSSLTLVQVSHALFFHLYLNIKRFWCFGFMIYSFICSQYLKIDFPTKVPALYN